MAFFSSLRQTISGKSKPFGLSQNLSQTSLSIIQAIALCLGMSMILGMIASYFVAEIPDNAHLIIQYLKEVPPLQAIFTIVVVWPIMEEMMFRLWLRPTRRTLSISLSMISVWIVTTFSSLFVSELTATELVQRRSLIGVLNRILPLILAIGIWYLLLGISWFQWWISALRRHWYVGLWVTSILFGRAHITNFTDKGIRYLIPLLTLPQTLIGFVLGAIRLQSQRRYTMVIHCIYNGLLVMPILIMMAAGTWIEQLSNLTSLEKMTSWQQTIIWLMSLYMMMLFLSVIVINGYSIWETWKRR